MTSPYLTALAGRLLAQKVPGEKIDTVEQALDMLGHMAGAVVRSDDPEQCTVYIGFDALTAARRLLAGEDLAVLEAIVALKHPKVVVDEARLQ